MKIKCWRFNIEVFFAWPLLLLISLASLITGIVLSLNDICYIIFLVISFIIMLICLYYLFINKRALSKIVFSQEHIKITWFKKDLFEFSWNDISDITTTLCGKGSRYLTFLIRNQSINMIPSTKIYTAIQTTCPIESIKTKVSMLFENQTLI